MLYEEDGLYLNFTKRLTGSRSIRWMNNDFFTMDCFDTFKPCYEALT